MKAIYRLCNIILYSIHYTSGRLGQYTYQLAINSCVSDTVYKLHLTE